MNGHGQSDRFVVPANPLNKAAATEAREGGEPPGTRSCTLEDRTSLARAVVEVLNPACEADLLGFSYGFRPGRSRRPGLQGSRGRT